MPKHISTSKPIVVALIAVLFIVVGFLVILSGFASINGQMIIGGFVIVFFGVILAGVNKLVFRVRTTQLSIDTKEAVRDRMRNACPSCGVAIPTGSQFCNTCGRRLSAETPTIRASEVPTPPPPNTQPPYQQPPPPTTKETLTTPCENCGTLIPLTAHFCANCGAKRGTRT